MEGNPVVSAILMVLAAILAILPQIVPGFKQWWEARLPEEKQLMQVGAIVVIGLALFGLSCTPFLAILLPGVAVACTAVGFGEVVVSILLAIAVNQGVYKGTNRIFQKKGEA